MGFCTIFQTLFCGSCSTRSAWYCSLCVSLILLLVLWFVPVDTVSKRHIVTQWTQSWKKDWCGCPPSSILWSFLLIFWQVLLVCVKLCHISLKFLLCIIQVGIRKKYLQSYSIPYFPVYFYLNDFTLISQQLSECQLSCFMRKGGLIGSKWLAWDTHWEVRDPELKSKAPKYRLDVFPL